jgi:hypothetical protein
VEQPRSFVSFVKRAQVLAELDWRLSVATANVLLEGLLALAQDARSFWPVCFITAGPITKLFAWGEEVCICVCVYYCST